MFQWLFPDQCRSGELHVNGIKWRVCADRHGAGLGDIQLVDAMMYLFCLLHFQVHLKTGMHSVRKHGAAVRQIMLCPAFLNQSKTLRTAIQKLLFGEQRIGLLHFLQQ